MGISSLVTRYTSNFKMLPCVIQKIKSNNQIPIIDYANENVKQYKHNYSVMCDTITKYPNTTMALKFSSLGLSYMYDNEVTKLARDIIELAKENKCTIMIDAEQDSIQRKINMWSNYLIEEYNKDKPFIYKTYQMYRKDSYDIFKNDLDKYKNIHLGIKLVRGAYYNTDKNRNVLFSNKEKTDESFNNAIRLFNSKHNNKHHLVVASHNKKSLELLDDYTHPNIAIAHLMGFSDVISIEKTKKYKVYKYLPFGNYKDTFPYLIRRLYENYPILLHLRN